MTIQSVEKLANDLMSKKFTIQARGERLTYSAKDLGYTFKWDNAKRRNGKINYGKREISLSKSKVEANLDKVNGVIKNTILHEIAHAFCYQTYGRNGRGHCQKWRSIAKQIGCSGERCTSGYESVKNSKYTLLCSTCGKESSMHRKPKLSRSCGKCSPNVYNEKYILEVIQNY
jgi:predicted SprT family Zn-dependent metalloprotease